MILQNCRLIPDLSAGVASEKGTVVIEKGLIKAVYSGEPENLSSEEPRFDCKGKTLLPGLIDLHTHIVVLNGIGLDKVHDPMELLVTAAKHATQYLDNGFTTIRDCGSTFRVANYVRDMVRNGSLEAPDMISCGRAIMPTETVKEHPMAQHLIFADGPEEVRKAARTEMAYGADYVKIFASGAAADPNGTPAQSIMTADEIRSIVGAAERKGRYVAAHCHSDDAIRMCIENGVRTIEHASLISDETLEKVIASDHVILIPTLAVMYIHEGPRKQYWMERLGPMFQNCTAKMEIAYRAGLKLGFGTDCCAGGYEYDNGIEFKFRKENCHMQDIDILKQATKINAEIAGIADQVGTIRAGLKANLILVDGKPDLDISAMYRRPTHVWKNGKLVRGA